MHTSQYQWKEGKGWDGPLVTDALVHLVFAFGSKERISNPAIYTSLRAMFPVAEIAFCSTAGEIQGNRVFDDSIVVTAISFAKAQVRCVQVNLNTYGGQRAAGKAIATQLQGEHLKLVFVLCDGSSVNGSEFAAGLNEGMPADVPITGGLAGDGDRFAQTLVGLNQTPTPDAAIGIAFYGPDLEVGHGCIGGWDAFGPERVVTRSEGNVLYELDGESALALYKRYLGDLAAGLPGTALRFPLSVQIPGLSAPLVRTILGVDEATQSMTFAGDIPQGALVRLMNANLERLIDAAEASAQYSLVPLSNRAELALLVSCIGRKVVLGQRVEEEVEAVETVVGANTAITGFYSYGELSPLGDRFGCELHNQTLTITTLAER
jgi:hypothetical protein